jgi:hypothetical protein
LCESTKYDMVFTLPDHTIWEPKVVEHFRVTRQIILQLTEKIKPLMEKKNIKYICAISIGIKVAYSMYKFFYGPKYL